MKLITQPLASILGALAKDQKSENSSSKQIIISAIVCTHNRVKLLETAIKSLIEQDYESTLYEIVIVDNGSKDGTRGLIASYSKGISAPKITYVYEGRLGISWARNAGWQSAQGKYIAYIDDDERAEPDWLRLLVTVLDDQLRDVVAVGGPIHLDWDGDRPNWLPVSMERFYSKVDLGDEARNLTAGEYPLTSNLAIRRELFDDLGGFRTDLGHVGNIPIGGEDVELIDRIHAIGKEIFYDPKAIIHHHVPKSRQLRKWLLRRCYYGGKSTPVLDNLKHVSIKEIFYNLRQTILFLFKTLWFMTKRQKKAVIENGCVSMINLGRAVGLICMLFKAETLANSPSDKAPQLKVEKPS